jgi:hypothetical protein
VIILEGGYPAAPTFTDAEVTEGLGMAYLKAVTVNAIRRGELRTAAVEIERRCSRLFWRAAGGAARGATTVIEPAGELKVPALPRYPRADGVTVSSVEAWTGGAWAPAAHSIEPGGRVRLHSPSRLVRIAAESLPPAEVPPEVLEATRRLFGWRDQHRPTGDRDTAVMLLAGGLRKSGAGELLQRSGYIVRTL